MAEIYALKDPNTLEVRYIGKADDSEKRLKSHLRDSKRRDYPVYRWIRKLLSNGQNPIVEVLLIAEDWETEETRIIQEYKDKGERLLNIAKGGDQPFCSIEQRKINGSKITSLIKNKRLWELKKQLSQELATMKRSGDTVRYNKFIDKIRQVAKRSNVFDCFMHLERI